MQTKTSWWQISHIKHTDANVLRRVGKQEAGQDGAGDFCRSQQRQDIITKAKTSSLSVKRTLKNSEITVWDVIN